MAIRVIAQVASTGDTQTRHQQLALLVILLMGQKDCGCIIASEVT
jgi:hypothetical protein